MLRRDHITNNIRWGLDNPHPFLLVKTELIWEGKYAEYGNRRVVDIAGCAMPLQKIETIDEPARAMILRELKDYVPADRSQQYAFFHPDLTDLPTGEANFHRRQATNLERTLVDQSGLMPIGLLRWCLDYTRTTRRKIGGVFEVVRTRFIDLSQTDLFSVIDAIYSFRNEYVAHQDRELSDQERAKQALIQWARGIHRIWSCR